MTPTGKKRVNSQKKMEREELLIRVWTDIWGLIPYLAVAYLIYQIMEKNGIKF